MLLQVLCVLLLTPAVLACLYYLLLACAGAATRRSCRAIDSSAAHRFAIVIPAHNEESTLGGVLQSCAQLEYPVDRVTVYVIADNCTDATAAVARAHGVICLERTDPERRGKGWALEWAFERILPNQPDAVVVLDADCTLDAHALREFDCRLQAGERVLQACNSASNPDATITSYVGGVANFIENHLYYAPKSRLGLAVLLRGTGMVFAREVLECHPWNAHSIVEDAEYTVRLYRAGLAVQFVPEASVRSQFAAGGRQLAVQRSRWIGGNASFGREHAGKLILDGLRHRRGTLIDLGWTLLVSTRSLVLIEMFLALTAALMCVLLTPGTVSSALLLIAAALPLVHGMVLGFGVLMLGLNRRRLTMLAGSPLVIARMFGIAMQGACFGPAAHWERTPR